MESFLNLFSRVQEVEGVYSTDKLYKCEDDNGFYHLCRFFDIKDMKRATSQYELLRQLKSQDGFQQVEYLLKCQDQKHGVLVLEWVDGQNLFDYLRENPAQQYIMGQKAGQLLRSLHSQEIIHTRKEEYQKQRLSKFESQLNEYVEMGGSFEKLDELLEKFHQTKANYKIEKLVQCHGDFHAQNIIINKDLELTLIDFGSLHIGDVSDDLNPLIFFDEPDFIKGVLDSYQPSAQEMTNTLVHLFASPRAVLWAISYGVQEVEYMIKLNQRLFSTLNSLGIFKLN